MRLLKYLLQYRFRDIGDLMRNSKKGVRECSESLKGKTVVLSGASSGIGLETARLFARQGARLICLNRDPVKSAAVEKELSETWNCQVRTILVDFSSLDQVRHCAAQLLALKEPIDVIIHNSGVHYTRKTLSADGIEMVFQVNHLASFLINQILTERLKAENRARILYVNSEGHRFALAGVHTNDLLWRWHWYTGLKGYGAAKTAQLLTMMKYREIFSGTNVTVNAMHPGNVVTNIGENNGRLYRALKRKLIMPSAKSPVLSAQALQFLACSPELASVSGKYFNLTTEERPAPHARDPQAVMAVWNKSLELCGLA